MMSDKSNLNTVSDISLRVSSAIRTLLWDNNLAITNGFSNKLMTFFGVWHRVKKSHIIFKVKQTYRQQEKTMTIVKPRTLNLAAFLIIILSQNLTVQASECKEDCREVFNFALTELYLSKVQYTMSETLLILGQYETIHSKCVQRCDLEEEEQKALKRLLRGVK